MAGVLFMFRFLMMMAHHDGTAQTDDDQARRES
jgi:hypothetical protein